MMIPFWGQIKSIYDLDNARFDQYVRESNGLFQLSSLEESELVVFPTDPFGPKFEEFEKLTSPKKLVAFFNSDLDVEIKCRENSYIFRTSFYKSKKKEYEFAVPGWSGDFGTFPVRQWNETPTVSFCGSLDRGKFRISGMDSLKRSSKINCNFIVRNSFWGGVSDAKDVAKQSKVRQEFMDNMCNSDYCFCCRGEGNFSYRIYEIMSNGRIPLFIDTDSVLPYDFIINWKDFFPIVEVKDIENMPDILLEFHNKNKNCFEEKQKIIRIMYEEYISPFGFFKNLYKHFKE